MPDTYATDIFARADLNTDGVLDFDEFVRYVRPEFDRCCCMLRACVMSFAV